MKWPTLAFIGLAMPFMALAQTAPNLVAQASDKKAHGDLNGALADYTQAIAQNPKDSRAYLGRATILSQKGNYPAAIADDSQAISLDPKNAIAFSNRGNARTASGDLTGALADYTQAIALDPHHVAAFLNRGNVKNLQQKYSAAIADYVSALALDPKNAAAFYDRGGARRALGNYAGALADYSEAIALNPSDVQAYINRAVLEMAKRNWKGATADLTKCLTLVPDGRQAYPRIYLWVVEVNQGNTEKTATAELTPFANNASGALAQTWGWEIAKFLTGQVTEAEFLDSAHSFQDKKDRGQKAQAFYYAGLKRKMASDRVGAVELFRLCVANGQPSLHEFILARQELAGGPAK